MKTLALILCSLITIAATAQIDEAIKFKITCPNGNTDETIVRLKDDATNAFDPQWDAWKIFTWNDMVPSLYTHTNDAYELTINAIPTMPQDTVVHLFVRAKITSGMYTLNTEQLGAFPSGVQVSLKDLETGEIYVLDQNILHDFYVQADPNNDQMRFEIFYSPCATATVNLDEVTIVNKGNFNWNYELFDSSDNSLQAGNNQNEEFQIQGLNNGDYYVVVSDSYMLVDTLTFNIFVEGEDPGDTTTYAQPDKIEEASISTAFITDNQNSKPNIYASNGSIKIKDLQKQESYTIQVYNLNGQLIHSEFQLTGEQSLPLSDQFSGQIVFVRFHSNSQEFTAKLLL